MVCRLAVQDVGEDAKLLVDNLAQAVTSVAQQTSANSPVHPLVIFRCAVCLRMLVEAVPSAGAPILSSSLSLLTSTQAELVTSKPSELEKVLTYDLSSRMRLIPFPPQFVPALFLHGLSATALIAAAKHFPEGLPNALLKFAFLAATSLLASVSGQQNNGDPGTTLFSSFVLVLMQVYK